MKAGARRGFTLIEMLAVMLVMSLLLTVALDFYIDLSRQTVRATELTRGVRRAHAILDRVAGDLEHTLLVAKPESVDPLTHPWVFLAEPQHAENGSDRLKFVRRVTPRSTDRPASDLAMVSYTLRRSEKDDGSFSLHRWSSPELPDALDREFPLEGDPHDLLLADGLSSFRLSFLDAGTGEWATRWDSSLIGQSGRLPQAVEIEVGVVGEVAPDPDGFGEEPLVYARRVQLPLPALDLEALLTEEEEAGTDGSGEGDQDEFADLTAGECISREEFAQVASAFTQDADAIYDQYQSEPWESLKAQFPEIVEVGSCQ